MKKKFLKITAIVLAINFLSTALAPTLSYALTAGPTAPEYTSFEPVDTTDMVNLSTGDFTYNIPLLEVPGPEGGYPLALSYHAGISPDEEASWVGLGWTLNAGAINRSVLGFPDDVYNSSKEVHDYWPGGQTNVFTVGLGYASASIDVDIAHDTYEGTGIGMSVGYGGISLSYAPYGGVSASAVVTTPTIGLSTEAFSAGVSGSVGISTNFETVQVGGAVGAGFNIVGIGGSISSNSSSPNFSFMGASAGTFAQNQNAGKISSYSEGFKANIPLPYGLKLRLGKMYQRYWSDEKDNLNMYGSLYAKNATGSTSNSSIDSYILPQFEQDNFSADQQRGGSFLSYDMYSVLGQGIGGIIQPYAFQNTNIYRQSIQSNGVNVVKFGRTDSPAQDLKLNFRFKNEFSNKFLITRGKFPTQNRTTDGSGNPFLSLSDSTKEFDEDYYNEDKNMLAGSRHVEWVTNEEIANGSFKLKSSFIPHEGPDFFSRPLIAYGKNIGKQIGGFVVTNASGVSYHYSQPVYSYGEYTKLTMLDGSYRENFNDQPFAYTWLLTAITGPDYVDRGTYGISDDDFGYWVSFQYGKWTDQYQYRTPFEGLNKDLDQGSRIYTSGKKELYYLDFIHTRSHTAFFEKDIRNDGKGIVSLTNGGITPTGEKLINSPYIHDSGTNSALNFPVSPLKLTNIYLFENSKLASLLNENQGTSILNLKGKGTGKYTNGYYFGAYHQVTSTPAGQCLPVGGQYWCYNYISGSTPVKHLWENVIDIYDIQSIANFDKNVLRKVTLNTSYDLCPNTANSVASNDNYYDLYKIKGYGPGPVPGSSVQWPIASGSPLTLTLGGKLTLNSVEFKGRGGMGVLPSTKFHYNNSDATGNYADIATDLINNPAYNKDKKDVWSNYKSDINLTELQQNENFARRVTSTSAQNVDAWSLKEIETPIGAKVSIDYESDEIETSVASKINNIPIKSIEVLNNQSVKINVENGLYNLTTLFGSYVQSNKKVQLIGSYRFTSTEPETGDDRCPSDEGLGLGRYVLWSNFNNEGTLNSSSDIGTNYIIVNFANPLIWLQYGMLNATGSDQVIDCDCSHNPYSDYSGSTNGPRVGPGNGTGTIAHNYIFRGNGTLVAGNLFFDTQFSSLGGGLRVKEISVKSNDGIYSTKYEYSNGASTFLPGGYDNNFQYQTDFAYFETIYWQNQSDANSRYRTDMAGAYKNELAYARELPGPGVMYGKVKVSENIREVNGSNVRTKPGYKEYNFRTFNFSGDTKDVEVELEVPLYPDPGRTRSHSIPAAGSFRNNQVIYKDYTSRIGNLISTIDYDNTNQKIGETIYEYLYNDSDPLTPPETQISNLAYNTIIDNSYNKQGHIEELFNEFRLLGNANSEVFMYTKRVEYPSVLKRIITKNYKTGISGISENLEFDFITGTPTKTLITDAYGNRFISETIFAHKVEEYKNGMGIKIFNDYQSGTRLSKNMLSQLAGTTVYKASSSNTPLGLVSAQVQTWKADSYTQSGGSSTYLWRPHRGYSWTGSESLLPDGTHNWTTFSNDAFNSWLYYQEPLISSYWQKDQEITKYNDYSKVIESIDINGSYSCVKTTPAQDMVIASASFAKYNQMGFSGAEYYTSSILEEGGIGKGQGNVSIDFAHTGKVSLAVAAGQNGFNVELPPNSLEAGRKYRASAWVYLPGFSESEKQQVKLVAKLGSVEVSDIATENRKAGNWYLLSLTVAPNQVNNLIIECKNQSASRTVYFDDFRFHPLDGSMVTYVYNKETRELDAILDGDNLYTRYEYDAIGRLSRVYSEIFGLTEKKVSSTKYNYERKN